MYYAKNFNVLGDGGEDTTHDDIEYYDYYFSS